ncbi:MAG: sulfatase-like hydrolase/transferase [Pirellulales bacterium]
MKKLLAAIVFGLLPLTGTVAAAEKPNVLLICVDDLKPLLHCYGTPIIQSPSIDRLADRGVLFECAFANQAVCAPSRNSLMTGFRPQTLGIYDLGTNFRAAVPDAVTLAQCFQRHGYRTEAMGKVFHVGHGNHEDPASWSVPHWGPKAGPAGGYVLSENRPAQLTREEALFSNTPGDLSKLPRGAATECADVPDNAYADGRIADEAIRRLQAAKAKPGQPWFIAVGFLKPHLPFCAPKKYWDLYDPAKLPMPALKDPPIGAPKFAPTTWGELRQFSDIPATGPLDDVKARHLIHGYHAAVSYMDAQLGRVLDAVDAQGFAKNTIIVLWGDHGWHLGDHGMWCKHTNYEQAARIPLLIAAPGTGKAGARTRALAETVDLYPTLCELAGLPAPAGLDGASLVAAIKNPAAAGKEAVFHVYPRGELMGRAVRTARHRLVEWKKPGAAAESAVLELYDYQSDPAETRNLAAEQPEVVAQLRAMLARQPEAKPQVRAARKTGTKAAAGKKAGAKASAGKPRQDRAAMFARRDTNGDGRLTREEFLANQPDPDQAPKRFVAFDTDKDGFLSREEFIMMGKTKP